MQNNSNLSKSDSGAPPTLYFEERFNSGAPIGQLIIWGLVLPHNTRFNPLDKIWSSVRKRIAEEYGIQVTGVFRKELSGEFIGGFMLNMAGIDDESSYDMLQSKFRDTFQIMMVKFEAILNTWVLNDNGLEAYRNYVEQQDNPDPDHCNEILDKFLISINVKTEKDLKEREKKKKEIRKHLAFVELLRRLVNGDEQSPEQS